MLAEEVRSAGLQGLAVLHHGFDAVGVEGAGEALGLGFVAYDHRHGHELTGEAGIDVDHLLGLGHGLVIGCVGGMPLLPQEFRGTEEETGAHLPAHDVGPLVAEDRKVAPRLDPVLVCIPDDGLGRGTYDEFLLQSGVRVDDNALSVGRDLQSVMRDDGALLGEALDMLGLAAEERLRNEEREVGVHVTRFLEHFVKLVLHLLPDGVAIRLYDHASAYRGLLGQVCLNHQIVVPL